MPIRAVTIVRHRVSDFDAWKQVYTVADMQAAGGVIEQAVLRSPDDPSMVIVVHTFRTQDEAKAFFGENPDLRDAMAAAGVDMRSFQIDFLDEVSAGRVAATASA
jgi:hypothetical protein